MNKHNKQEVLILLMVITILGMFVKNYVFTYLTMSTLLLFVFLTYNSINIKVICGFFFAYYFIPLPNISTYRGTIVYETLALYTLMILLALLPIVTKIKLGNNHKIKKNTSLEINWLFRIASTLHLILVYLLLLYVYLKYGNVVFYQELRFKIPPAIGYLIKSSIYIPLFLVFILKNKKFSYKKLLKYLFLPLLPAVFIGSRGTVILVLISVSMLLIVGNTKLGKDYSLKDSIVWSRYKKRIYRLVISAMLILHFFYYSRRIFSDKLLSNMEVIEKFFDSTNPFYLIILPLYASFRETIGLANIIIKNDYNNTFTELPLFFQEFATVLPGQQLAPGRAIGQLVGTSLDGGLTPNILGGLYPDFGYLAIFGCIGFTMVINYFYRKSIYNDFYKILYVITLTQFFHLFHRGFLKPEYVFSYIIIIMYFLILNRRSSENPSYRLPITS